jgi:plasmid stabilization system protein ParE
MDFKVVFRDTFLEDLEGVVRSIAAHNPDAARKLGELIISAGESLSFFPERHPKVRQRPGIRRFIVKKYFKVFYRVHRENMTVEILRCWDGRRGTEPTISEGEN